MPLGPRIRNSRKNARGYLLSHSAFHETLSCRQQLVQSYLLPVSASVVPIANKIGLKKLFSGEKIG